MHRGFLSLSRNINTNHFAFVSNFQHSLTEIHLCSNPSAAHRRSVPRGLSHGLKSAPTPQPGSTVPGAAILQGDKSTHPKQGTQSTLPLGGPYLPPLVLNPDVTFISSSCDTAARHGYCIVVCSRQVWALRSCISRFGDW